MSKAEKINEEIAKEEQTREETILEYLRRAERVELAGRGCIVIHLNDGSRLEIIPHFLAANCVSTKFFHKTGTETRI